MKRSQRKPKSRAAGNKKSGFTSAKPFSLLIKPASADCNLRCSYCFYLPKSGLYPETRRHRMPAAVLERMVQSYMATDQPVYAFIWQGGEPTLMGLDFFKTVTRLQQKYGGPGVRVSNALQTNATRISDGLARHFRRYNYLVGGSLDAPAAHHDRYRRTVSDRPTHNKVLRGLATLNRHNVDVNILTLVNRDNATNATAVYDDLRKRGYLFQQYIPCVEFDTHGNPLPHTVTPKAWGRFLGDLFDRWYERDVRTVSIRLFDSILQKLVTNSATDCTQGTDCRQYFVVEYNGDIYPCDFFVEPRFRLGNVMTDGWEAMLKCARYKSFGRLKRQWNTACDTCRCLTLCHGDCLKHRLYGGHSARNLSYLCAGWQRFYDHTRQRFETLARTIRREQETSRQPVPGNPSSRADSAGIGRNAPCPCGSAKKYKRCCGR